MSGFSTYDALVNAYCANRVGQKVFFQKTMAQAGTAGVANSLWNATGIPSAGGNTATGKANGRVLVGGSNGSPTTGSIPFNAGSGGTKLFLTGMAAGPQTAATPGFLMLIDRISDVNLAINEGTGTITGLNATSRLTGTGGAYPGAQLFLEVTTAFGAASNTFSLNYTNQNGTTNRTTTVNTKASAAVMTSGNNLSFPFLSLSTNDVGVRSVESLTLTTANTTTGAFNLCLVRPLAIIPWSVGSVTYGERDFVLEMPALEEIPTNACLSFLVFNGTQTTYFGELRIVSN